MRRNRGVRAELPSLKGSAGTARYKRRKDVAKHTGATALRPDYHDETFATTPNPADLIKRMGG